MLEANGAWTPAILPVSILDTCAAGQMCLTNHFVTARNAPAIVKAAGKAAEFA